jgi:hypothetical protein
LPGRGAGGVCTMVKRDAPMSDPSLAARIKAERPEW